ncbi:tRNA N(3)-methylcytidine methyltransferase METTL2-like [Mya arenaria]|uniref:tRNA N(3)-methylcytidine methyltransferase METTL2-like n=1 Tax=Mya arenaria TaxID=6604 RepID=UPI0022E0850A|nr:tRNA N(3)-methylcytidine methyltransferase METTL2-like [Mya arenaria]
MCLRLVENMAESNNENDDNAKRKQFGNRFLTDTQNVFEHNAWDNVVWNEDQEMEARAKTEEQLANRATQEQQEKFEEEADQFWDKFYCIHENKFFKDRHWLFTEFPELAPEYYLNDGDSGNVGMESHGEMAANKTDGLDINSECVQRADENGLNRAQIGGETPVLNSEKSEDEFGSTVTELYPGQSAKFRILEVGCGVGNTVFPILKANRDPGLMVYCCDFSKTAVDLVKENADYERRCHAFHCDISNPESTVPFPDNSLDVIICIFVLSAINPDKFQAVINRLTGFLKPGGVILFRDYGRYDMAQLRFKKGRCLSENFYARGDGTRVYFFTQVELGEMMTNAGLVEKQNLVDRRLQVNRGRQLKMYRVWIQCKYVKPGGDNHSTVVKPGTDNSIKDIKPGVLNSYDSDSKAKTTVKV